MADVIALPVTKKRPAVKKRPRVPPPKPEERQRQREEEEHKRRRNIECVAVLGEEDASVRQLEELLFGAEERLVERLEEEEDQQVEQLYYLYYDIFLFFFSCMSTYGFPEKLIVLTSHLV